MSKRPFQLAREARKARKTRVVKITAYNAEGVTKTSLPQESLEILFVVS